MKSWIYCKMLRRPRSKVVEIQFTKDERPDQWGKPYEVYTDPEEAISAMERSIEWNKIDVFNENWKEILMRVYNELMDLPPKIKTESKKLKEGYYYIGGYGEDVKDLKGIASIYNCTIGPDPQFNGDYAVIGDKEDLERLFNSGEGAEYFTPEDYEDIQYFGVRNESKKLKESPGAPDWAIPRGASSRKKSTSKGGSRRPSGFGPSHDNDPYGWMADDIVKNSRKKKPGPPTCEAESLREDIDLPGYEKNPKGEDLYNRLVDYLNSYGYEINESGYEDPDDMLSSNHPNYGFEPNGFITSDADDIDIQIFSYRYDSDDDANEYIVYNDSQGDVDSTLLDDISSICSEYGFEFKEL